MIEMSLEEFSSRRTAAQAEIEAALAPIVERALDGKVNTGGWGEVVRALRAQYRTAYESEGGVGTPRLSARWIEQVVSTLRKTDKKNADATTVATVSTWLATSLLSQATMAAGDAEPGEVLLEWVTMRDSNVRDSHRAVHGQRREPGKKFSVGGATMLAPGDVSAPIEEWINCRCSLRLVAASDSLVAAAHDLVWVEGRRTPKVVKKGERYKPSEKEGRITKRRAATAEEEKTISRGDWVRVNEHGDKPSDSGYKRKKSKVRPQKNTNSTASDLQFAQEDLGEPTHAGVAVQAADTGRLLMIQRQWDESDAPDVRGTWEFPGGTIEDGESPEAAAWREFSEETGLPQPEGETTNGWRSPDGVYQGYVFTVPVEAEAFEELNPDVDAQHTENPDNPQRRHPDITAWFTVEQATGLGAALRPEVAAMDWSIFDREETEMTDEFAAQVGTAEEYLQVEDGMDMPGPEPMTWHSVFAPEGIPSGDGRMFAAGALQFAPLPLPLTWQKTSQGGHDGNVTVAKTTRLERVGNEIHAEGTWLATPEADEVISLVAEFGRFGVSIDADSASFEMDEDAEAVVFSSARIRAACIVSIPAFAEAYVALGPAPEGFFDGGEPVAEEGENEALVAADIAPGKTEDGPGWLTHPVDTDRLRDYWTKGAGAAKIGWGSPGDFNRCRINLAEYIKPQYLSGYCANRHYDALGTWPGQHASAADTLTDTTPSEPISMVASVGRFAPSEWFTDPGLSSLTPLTITEEGRVFGHIAGWKTCHASWADTCVTPPHSATNYAHFLLGEVLTDAGPIPVGNLTVGGGHAGPGLNARAAIEHYDSTSSVFADVTVGEDEHGIWFSGWVRPGTPDEMLHAARASKLSGDWRRVGASMEMVAALAVNVPGFRIPRLAAGMLGDRQVSLVAAGVVAPDATEPQQAVVDGFQAREMARLIAEEMVALQSRRDRMLALSRRMSGSAVEEN